MSACIPTVIYTFKSKKLKQIADEVPLTLFRRVISASDLRSVDLFSIEVYPVMKIYKKLSVTFR